MDWRVLEHELGDLGNKLDELREQEAAVGDDALVELSDRFEDISRKVIALKETSQEELHNAMDTGNSAEPWRITAATDLLKDKADAISGNITDAAAVTSDAVLTAGQHAKEFAQAASGNFAVAWESLKADIESRYKKVMATRERKNGN